MTNLVVTSTTNSILVDFGVYANPIEEGTFRKEKITFLKDANTIHAVINGEGEWLVSHDGASSSMIIDTVNGVAPTDLSDLYTKLKALIA